MKTLQEELRRIATLDIEHPPVKNSGNLIQDCFRILSGLDEGETIRQTVLVSISWDDEMGMMFALKSLRDSMRHTLYQMAFKESDNCLDDGFKGEWYKIICPPRRKNTFEPESVSPYVIVQHTSENCMLQENPEYFRCSQEQFIERTSQPAFNLVISTHVTVVDGKSRVSVIMQTQPTSHKLRSGWGRLNRWHPASSTTKDTPVPRNT